MHFGWTFAVNFLSGVNHPKTAVKKLTTKVNPKCLKCWGVWNANTIYAIHIDMIKDTKSLNTGYVQHLTCLFKQNYQCWTQKCVKNHFSWKLLKILGVGAKLNGIHIVNHTSVWLLCLIIKGKYRPNDFMHNTLTDNDLTRKYCEDTQYIGNLWKLPKYGIFGNF